MTTPTAQIEYFRSDVDGALHPCAVCATDTGDEPKPLIVEVSPGALNNLPGAMQTAATLASIAAQHGKACVVLRATSRGPGTVCQNYGEVDVLEAIEHVARYYPIDRRRITVTGSSMGGAATWYLASHYPDLFAGAAPFCGYCDYRLWEKPGGHTFHMHAWEEHSWRSRSAIDLVENFAHTPVWIVHGEWDRSIGGGVPAEHSQQMHRRLCDLGYDVRYTEVPKTGHSSDLPELWSRVVLWLLEQEKAAAPRHVPLVTYGLRHNRSYWVTIEQFEKYGDRGEVDANFASDRQLIIHTRNVRTLKVDALPACDPVTVNLDGSVWEGIAPAQGATFRRCAGDWELSRDIVASEKRHGASGPVGDLFFERVLLVPGTAGTDEETFFNRWVATHAASYYRSRNGGVHRGGIPGENWVDLPVIPDSELTGEQLASSNLLLYGTFRTNAVLARFEGRLPVSFAGNTIRLCGREFTSDRTAVFAVFPHPDHPSRYVAIHGGVAPDAISWGSHLDMHLLPDYLVYSGGETLDWGLWGNRWETQS